MRYSVSLFLVLMIATAGASQETRIMDVKEAIDVAMTNNIQVITAQNTYNSTAASVLPKTLGSNLPTVSANASYGRTFWSAVNKNILGRDTSLGGPSNSYSYSLSADYTIFDGFRKFNDMSQARLNENSAWYDVENTKQEITLQVYQSYFNVLKNKQLLKITEENLKRSEEQLKKLEERNRLGAQIMSDVYRQRVQVGSDKLAVNKAKNNLNTSKAALNNLIGIDVNTSIELKELDTDVKFDKAGYDFSKAYTEGLEQRKDYQAAMKRVESTQRTVRNARSGYYPTLSAFADYKWTNTAMSMRDYSNKDNMMVGLQLSIPIFNGFQTSSSVIQADQTLQTSKSNLENIRRKVALDIKIALLNLQTSYENVKLSEENVQSAKEDLRLATERYNLGAGTILDQITANTNYATAEANYIQSVYDFLYSKEQYNLAIGKIQTKE